MELGFYRLHRVLRQSNPCLIGRGHQGHDRVFAAPWHGPGQLEPCVNRVEPGPIPMVLEDAPTTFERIVLAVIGRIVRQPDGELLLLHEGDEPLHTLGAPVVIVGAIIQIESQGRAVGEALTDCRPPFREASDEAITGHFGCDPIPKELAPGGPEDAHGCDRRLRGKLVVRGRHLHAVLPAAGAGANFDGRLGIHGEAQDVVRGLSCLSDLGHLREDGVRCGNFFGADSWRPFWESNPRHGGSL